MIPFGQVLSEADRRHIRMILDSSVVTDAPGVKARSKVPAFLREHTYMDEGSAQAFQAMEPVEREQLLSDLIWRVTCYLDGSITRVGLVNKYDLGGEFCAVQSEQDGREIFCLVRSTS